MIEGIKPFFAADHVNAGRAKPVADHLRERFPDPLDAGHAGDILKRQHQQQQSKTAKPAGPSLADAAWAATSFNRAWWKLLWGMLGWSRTA